MTGTADTEAYEFQEIYGLETVVIPPNKPTIRKDEIDLIYKTAKEKYDAVIEDIRDCHERGQPVLVGTTSIENSELISGLLTKAKLPHQVLNAKQHAKEAEIVAQAGRPGVITIATNMAGRGTDIVLGGNVEKQVQLLEADEAVPADEKARRIQQLQDEWQGLHDQVKASGGLRIIATERHESRRIDNQLRGRSGRQGDPGSSRFYLSLDDSLMRIFAGDRVRAIMDRLKMPEGEAIEAGIVKPQHRERAAQGRGAQLRHPQAAARVRRRQQRPAQGHLPAAQRDPRSRHRWTSRSPTCASSAMTDVVRTYVPAESLEEQWDLPAWRRCCATSGSSSCRCRPRSKPATPSPTRTSSRRWWPPPTRSSTASSQAVGAEQFTPFMRMVLLQSIDSHWREHLAALDYLRQGIHLRGYAQKNPKQEYKREAFELFTQLLDVVKMEVTRVLMTVRIQSQEQVAQAAEAIEAARHAGRQRDLHAPQRGRQRVQRGRRRHRRGCGHAAERAKVGRNEPCPCGSGKKYKHCHGRLA